MTCCPDYLFRSRIISPVWMPDCVHPAPKPISSGMQPFKLVSLPIASGTCTAHSKYGPGVSVNKFYTGKGDDGTTGLLGEGRVPKYDLRMEAIGSVDEASAALGVARGLVVSPENRIRILRVQRELYQLMAELASTPETADRFHT
ncbi:ATP:cob(I)alamin adenosyltransferase, partial [bacterium]|nr:ATP:cob(I)alamin adenosyltransferase [bacterium]